MSEVIQCPTCSKKFRLPDRPPAEFTCTACQTVMDLSAFGGVPAAAAVAPAAGGAGVPTTRRNRARGGGGGRRRSRGGGGAPRGRSRGGRGRAAPQDDYYDEDDGGRRRGRGRQQQNNNALIWGSLAAVLVAVVLIFAFSKKDDKKPDGDEDVAKQNPAAGTSGTGMMPGVGPANPVPGTGVAPLPGGTPAAPGGTPAAPGDTQPPKPPRAGARSGIRMKDIKLQEHEWPEEVDAATRAAAPEKLTALYDGGRDGIEAEEWFIEQGNKVAGFLISQFKVIDDAEGLSNAGSMTKIMVLDRTLCKMDGYLARKWNSTEPITHVSDASYAMARLKRWTAWWLRGYWKEHSKPWDPRVDEIDPDAPQPEDNEGRGFGGEKDDK